MNLYLLFIVIVITISLIVLAFTSKPRTENYSENQNVFVSVKDFGAVGDGVTDDTAAFQKAFNSPAKTVLGKSGDIYLVKDLIINGKNFDGQGCVLRDAPNAKWGVQLTGYNPQFKNCLIQDQGNYTVQTTTTALVPATSITLSVVSATGIKAGDVLFVKTDSTFLRWQTIVVSVNGNNIMIRDAIPEQASSGAEVVSLKGWLWVSDATWWNILDVLVVNARGALLIKPTSIRQFSNQGTIMNFSTDGIRYFGIAKIENSAGVKITNAKLWGGYVEKNEYDGDGTKTTFNFTTPVFLKRDVSVYINDNYSTSWTYTTDNSITFNTAPLKNSKIRIENARDGFRGFIEDQRFNDEKTEHYITGGNIYNQVECLDAFIGIVMYKAQLTDFQDLIIDTCSGVGLVLVDVDPFNVRFGKTFVGFGPSSIQAYSCNGILFESLYTNRVPQSYSYPPIGDNIISDNSVLKINAGNWTGGDYQIKEQNGGSVDLLGARELNFASQSTVASNSVVSLTSIGQSNTYVMPTDGQAIKLIVQCGAVPGVGQSFTYTLVLDNTNTPFSVSIIGNTFSTTLVSVQGFSRGSNIGLRLTTSAGATSTTHRAVLVTK